MGRDSKPPLLTGAAFDLALVKEFFKRPHDKNEKGLCRLCGVPCLHFKPHLKKMHKDDYESFLHRETRKHCSESSNLAKSYLDSFMEPMKSKNSSGDKMHNCILCPALIRRRPLNHLEKVHPEEYNHYQDLKRSRRFRSRSRSEERNLSRQKAEEEYRSRRHHETSNYRRSPTYLPQESMEQYNDFQGRTDNVQRLWDVPGPSGFFLPPPKVAHWKHPVIEAPEFQEDYRPLFSNVRAQVSPSMDHVSTRIYVKEEPFDYHEEDVICLDNPHQLAAQRFINPVVPMRTSSLSKHDQQDQLSDGELPSYTESVTTDTNWTYNLEGSYSQMTTKKDVGLRILKLKKRYSLQWGTIADMIGMDKFLVANACIGPDPLPESAVNQLAIIFELDEEAARLLRRGDLMLKTE